MLTLAAVTRCLMLYIIAASQPISVCSASEMKRGPGVGEDTDALLWKQNELLAAGT